MSLVTRIGYSARQAGESFLLSAGLHYYFKRNLQTTLICGGIAAGLTLIESAIYPLGEADDETLFLYKPVLITIAITVLALSGKYSLTKKDALKSMGYSFLASLVFVLPISGLPESMQSNRYIIWLK